jgi:hypothetical protein
MVFIFSVLSRIVSEVSLFKIKALPADWLHCFNFFTISIKREYLKLVPPHSVGRALPSRRGQVPARGLDIEAFPAYSNIKRLINLTSG